MRTAFALAMLAAAAPAVAQDARKDGDTIVVTGERVTRDEAREEAKGFVRNIAAIPVDGQFARWKKPVCVKVTGIGAANAKFVADRIAGIATDAGIALAPAGCKTSLLVAFAYDAGKTVTKIRQRHSKPFFATSLPDRALLAQSELPVRWWYQTDLESADGMAATGQSTAVTSAQSPGEGGVGIPSIEGARYTDAYRSSLIGTQVRVKIEGATVIVDTGRAAGKTLNAVASYVAMVSLARVKLGAVATDDRSILALFSNAGSPPSDLSANDRAFLAALYKVPDNRSAKVQEAAIVAEMIKAMTGG